MSAEDALARAEALLARLEDARAKLEATEDPEQAIEVLQELAELAKAVEAELETARRAGDAVVGQTATGDLVTAAEEPAEPAGESAPEADTPPDAPES